MWPLSNVGSIQTINLYLSKALCHQTGTRANLKSPSCTTRRVEDRAGLMEGVGSSVHWDPLVQVVLQRVTWLSEDKAVESSCRQSLFSPWGSIEP